MMRMRRECTAAKLISPLYLLGLILFLATAAWAQPRGGDSPPEDLPEELRGLDIKDDPIASSCAQAGVIHALQGRVVVVRGDTGNAFFGAGGDAIHEGDALHTLAESRCRVRLLSDDVVTMAPETRFSVDSFSDRREEGCKTSLFSMLKGKAMFYALRLLKYKETRFTLKTPTAVVGVRGTKFGAHVYRTGGETSARGPFRVADRGGDMGPYLAQVPPRGEGGVITDCFSEDGTLDVNGSPVGPGEIYRGETGDVLPTPPGYVKAFESSTEVAPEETAGREDAGEKKEGEETGKEEGEEEEKAEGEAEDEESEGVAAIMESGGGEIPAEATEVVEAAIETTQQEVATGTQAGAEALDISRGKVLGEVSAMAALLLKSGGGVWFNASPLKV
ncbi:MAG: FecR domain-containing protein, partial [Deltaproteobacteria bacterium]|nr:FecR domain-containing protein [Deltaproteobacteria bacterium]